MKKMIMMLLCLSLFPVCCDADNSGQFTPIQKAEQGEAVYIPKNLDDCFAELKKILTPEELKGFKNKKEEDIIDYHHGLGMRIRNNWGLWSESRLADYFNSMGIYHPDDMSQIILDSFYRYLNNKDLKLQEQIAYYQKYWFEIARDDFNELKEKWQTEKEQHAVSSISDDYWESEAGKKIIALNKRALPFIMMEIEKGVFLFNVPAEKITGMDIEGPTEKEKSEQLLEWWEKNRNNPEWNLFSLIMSKKRTLDTFKNIKPGMNYKEVETVVGGYDKDVGSGLYIFSYELSDGSRVLIGFTDLKKPLLYLKHELLNGSLIDMFKKEEDA